MKSLAYFIFAFVFIVFTQQADAQNEPKAENLGPNINTQYTELRPVISPDGKTLFFIREGHPENMGQGADQDVWFSTLQSDGSWSIAKNIGKPISNTSNNAAQSITPDGNTLLLSNRYNSDGSVTQGASISHRIVDGWSFPQPIDIKNFNNKSKYVDFCLANDGREILMAIESDSTIGERDIYVSFLSNDGSWTTPMDCGPELNTTSKDASPFLASDGVTLYFASDGYGGYGGRDIFVSHRLDDSWKHWSKPVNMGPQINGPGFDAYYSLTAKGDYAYFVSGASGGFGNEDIYRIKLEESLRPKPVILVSGHVYNQKTKQPLASSIRYEVFSKNGDAGVALSNGTDGAYKIVLPAGKKYGFRGEAPGFVSVNANVDASQINQYTEITKDLYLAPIEVNQTIRVNNIFFETAKSDLQSDSYSELDRVVTFLNENPTLQIAIKGHTDNVGSDSYNMNLSTNRAKSVLTYLVSKGIDAKRLSSKGYGKTQPLVNNDTEETRAQNRRVEFTIVKS